MLNALASLRLFFGLCLALAAAFVYQTLFNRGAPVYGSWWFAALGVLAAANIAACALRRKGAPAHYLLIHAGLVVVVAGAFVTRFFRFEAELPLRVGQASDKVYSGRQAWQLPFSVRLDDFSLEYYSEPAGVLTVDGDGGRGDFAATPGAVIELPGATLKVLRVARDFGLTAKKEVTDKSPYWFNPAAQVEVSAGGKRRKLWVFANFPGMHEDALPFRLLYSLEQTEIKNFTSRVTVTYRGGEKAGEIAVNRPLRAAGYTLYQTSYDPADAKYTLLTVTRDRGAWVVYAGFGLLLAGILLWLRK